MTTYKAIFPNKDWFVHDNPLNNFVTARCCQGALIMKHAIHITRAKKINYCATFDHFSFYVTDVMAQVN